MDLDAERSLEKRKDALQRLTHVQVVEHRCPTSKLAVVGSSDSSSFSCCLIITIYNFRSPQGPQPYASLAIHLRAIALSNRGRSRLCKLVTNHGRPPVKSRTDSTEAKIHARTFYMLVVPLLTAHLE